MINQYKVLEKKKSKFYKYYILEKENQNYFAKRAIKSDISNSNDNQDVRVRVKENSLA